MTSLSRYERIVERLESVFAPEELKLRDISAEHHGHAGSSDEGETHFTLEIKAPALSNLTRLEAHRAINEALKDELQSGLHALQIQIQK